MPFEGGATAETGAALVVVALAVVVLAPIVAFGIPAVLPTKPSKSNWSMRLNGIPEERQKFTTSASTGR